MKVLFILALICSSALSSTQVHAQFSPLDLGPSTKKPEPPKDPNAPEPKNQFFLAAEEVFKKGLIALVTPMPLLVAYKTYPKPKFIDVIRKHPEVVAKLKAIQKTNWDFESPRNFLSFSYKELNDLYVDKVGFCSGYTYVTWMLRYLLTVEEGGKRMTTKEMIAELNKVLYEFKPGKITHMSGIKEVSSVPEIQTYLKHQVARTWKESSITTEGIGMYLDQYRDKPMNWNSLISKVRFYWNNGIYPILYAVNREPWSKFADPEEVRMVHVMPAISTNHFILESYEITKDLDSQYLKELKSLEGLQELSLLHTTNKFEERTFIRSGTDAQMLGYDVETDSMVTTTYLNVIYYQDWLAARIALALIGQP